MKLEKCQRIRLLPLRSEHEHFAKRRKYIFRVRCEIIKLDLQSMNHSAKSVRGRKATAIDSWWRRSTHIIWKVQERKNREKKGNKSHKLLLKLFTRILDSEMKKEKSKSTTALFTFKPNLLCEKTFFSSHSRNRASTTELSDVSRKKFFSPQSSYPHHHPPPPIEQ